MYELHIILLFVFIKNFVLQHKFVSSDVTFKGCMNCFKTFDNIQKLNKLKLDDRSKNANKTIFPTEMEDG